MPKTCAAIVIAAKHGQLIKVKDYSGITNTVGALRCKFEFRTNDWDNATMTAVFCKGNMATQPEIVNNAISVLLDSVDECAVPAEVLTKDAKYFSVGIWGVTATGLRIVSEWLVFRVKDGCYVDATEPIEPTPTVYEQIMLSLQSKASIDHKHDDIYYTKSEINDIVDGVQSGTNIEEMDPTVPNWAKQPNKPSYTAEEVGALPNTTKIPTATADLINNSEFVTKSEIDEYVKENAGVQPDYLQNDPTAKDYIKNRPFYSEVVTGINRDIIPIQETILNEGGLEGYLLCNIPLESIDVVEGGKYNLTIDETTHQITTTYNSIVGGFVFGNLSLLGIDSTDTGEDFVGSFVSDGDPLLFGMYLKTAETTHTVGLSYIGDYAPMIVEDSYTFVADTFGENDIIGCIWDGHRVVDHDTFLLFREGDVYNFTFNGQTYENVQAKFLGNDGQYDIYYMGNLSILYSSLDNTGEEFVLFPYEGDEGLQIATSLPAGDYTVSLERVLPSITTEVIHKIDNKYLDINIEVPYTIDDEDSIIFTGDIKTSNNTSLDTVNSTVETIESELTEVKNKIEETAHIQSDYSQNDPTEKDYIKNRPFYIERTLVNDPHYSQIIYNSIDTEYSPMQYKMLGDNVYQGAMATLIEFHDYIIQDTVVTIRQQIPVKDSYVSITRTGAATCDENIIYVGNFSLYTHKSSDDSGEDYLFYYHKIGRHFHLYFQQNAHCDNGVAISTYLEAYRFLSVDLTITSNCGEGDVYHKIDANFLPDEFVSVQADYLQNDPAAKDYIKNRPFYTETITEINGDIIPLQEVRGEAPDGTPEGYLQFSIDSIEKIATIVDKGQYNLIIDGVPEPITTIFSPDMGAFLFGNLSIVGMGDSSEESYVGVIATRYDEKDGFITEFMILLPTTEPTHTIGLSHMGDGAPIIAKGTYSFENIDGITGHYFTNIWEPCVEDDGVYNLTFNGEFYEGLSWSYDEASGIAYLGNPSIAEIGDDNGKNYLLARIGQGDGSAMLLMATSCEADDYMVSFEKSLVKTIETIHKIDGKYLNISHIETGMDKLQNLVGNSYSEQLYEHYGINRNKYPYITISFKPSYITLFFSTERPFINNLGDARNELIIGGDKYTIRTSIINTDNFIKGETVINHLLQVPASEVKYEAMMYTIRPETEYGCFYNYDNEFMSKLTNCLRLDLDLPTLQSEVYDIKNTLANMDTDDGSSVELVTEFEGIDIGYEPNQVYSANAVNEVLTLYAEHLEEFATIEYVDELIGGIENGSY